MLSKDPLPPHPQRRLNDLADDPVHRRRMTLENRMDMLEEKLEKNTELTQRVVDVFGTLESGIKVLGWLGAAAKWVVSIGAAVGMVWAIANGKDIGK